MKRLLTTLVILTGLLGSAGAVWADAQSDVEKGMKAAQSGDFATALKHWKPLAEQGGCSGECGCAGLSWFDVLQRQRCLTGYDCGSYVVQHLCGKREYVC